MSEPRFHPAARVELVEAILAHEAARSGYGARFVTEVEAAVLQIAEHPESGSRLPGYPDALDVRAFRVRTFRYSLIVATVNREAIAYAVAHQHRRPGYWQDRLR